MSISTSVFGAGGIPGSATTGGIGSTNRRRKEVRQSLCRESVRQRDLTQLTHVFHERNAPGMKAEDVVCAWLRQVR
jgi:hypothetical protein